MGTREVPFSGLLSDIVDNRGKTCPTADSGIPLIATNCIRNELLYPTYEKVRFVSPQTYSTWFRGHPRPGDILFVNKATPGRVSLVPDPVDFCIAQDMVAVRADPSKVYPRYLFAVLRSPVAQERVAQMHVGTLIPHFKKGDFDKLLLPLPSSDQQKFIGDLYFELSAKIDINRRMNETLEAMARALFKSWFVDFEPMRAKAEGSELKLPHTVAELFPTTFQTSTLGEIPRGWSVQRIDEVAERVAMGPFGSSIKVDTFVPEGVPVISGQHLWGMTLLDSEFNFVTGAHADRLLRSNVQRGDVIFTHAGSIGQVAMIPTTSKYERYVLSQRQFYMRCKTSKMLPLYVTLYFKTPEGQHRLLANTSQVGVPSIAQPVSYLRQLEVVVPPIDLLRQFDRIAGELLSRCEVARRESTTLAALRDTLLPKLISGELRVKQAERAVEAVA